MIMGPFKPFVLKALDKIKDLSIKFICPGHGMVLDGANIENTWNYIENGVNQLKEKLLA